MNIHLHLLIYLLLFLETKRAKKFDWKKLPKPKEFLPPKPILVAPLLVRQKHHNIKTHIYRGGPLTPSFNQLNPTTGDSSVFQPPISTSAIPMLFSRSLSTNPQIYFNTTQVEVPALTKRFQADIEQSVPLKISDQDKKIIQTNANNEVESLQKVLATRINTLKQDIKDAAAAISDVQQQISNVFNGWSSRFSSIVETEKLSKLDQLI